MLDELQKLPRRHDEDPFMLAEDQEVSTIAGDQIVGRSLHRGRHDHVILRIEGHRLERGEVRYSLRHLGEENLVRGHVVGRIAVPVLLLGRMRARVVSSRISADT